MKTLTKDEFIVCGKIADRARNLGLYENNPVTCYMDIENAARYWHMRLEDWLSADDFDFVHDIVGICENIIREYPVLFTPYFVPRFSGLN